MASEREGCCGGRRGRGLNYYFSRVAGKKKKRAKQKNSGPENKTDRKNWSLLSRASLSIPLSFPNHFRACRCSGSAARHASASSTSALEPRKTGQRPFMLVLLGFRQGEKEVEFFFFAENKQKKKKKNRQQNNQSLCVSRLTVVARRHQVEDVDPGPCDRPPSRGGDDPGLFDFFIEIGKKIERGRRYRRREVSIFLSFAALSTEFEKKLKIIDEPSAPPRTAAGACRPWTCGPPGSRRPRLSFHFFWRFELLIFQDEREEF